jgi:uncharacterized lipoprotein YajG
MKKMLAIAATALLLNACAAAPTNQPATMKSTSAAIAAAEAANKQAASVGFEWRDTAQIIKEAKKAAEAKEYEKASKLAKQAEHQGISAVKQAETAKMRPVL